MQRTKSVVRTVVVASKWFSVALATSLAVACAPSMNDGTGSTGGKVGVGQPGTGGATGSVDSGSTNSGGAIGTGGAASSTGGATSTGGAVGSGGGVGTGGSKVGTGGQVGGVDAGASGGSPTGSGGVNGSGGATGGNTGGSTATGGKVGTGGSNAGGANAGGTGTGGATGTGGSTGASGVCPAGITQTITVAKDGSGQFTSVQAAVNSIASGSAAHIRIDIKAGTYTEKITIASRTNLCLVGASVTTTILAYGDNNAAVGSTSGTASVLVSANDFSAANLTIQNTFGSGSQAVALRTTGQRQQFLNCRFVGYQDTLYTHQGTQYFKNCYVQGNTDYVFGGATAVLDNCEMRNVEGGSAVSAPNTDIGTAYGIVFLGGKFTAVSSVKASSVAMGRPWGADGFAAYLHVDLGAHILPAGFVVMSSNQPENARFHEYQSTGSAASTSGRSGYQLNATQAATYTLSKIFGTWTPTYSQ